MRILNVCETARGGVGTYQGYISRLGERGYDMHFLMPAQDADFPDTDLQLHRFDRTGRNAGSLARLVGQTRRLIRRLEPDICFFHSSLALLPMMAARAARTACPIVYCPHGWAVNNYDAGTVRRQIVQRVEARLAGLADRVVCVSQFERDQARSLGYRGRFDVIENGVPPPPDTVRADLFGQQPDHLHLLFVGRFDRQKGFDILMQAMQRCKRRDIHLHVVGGAVRGASPAPAVPDGVTLHGWVQSRDIDPWYRSAHALLVPSRWEGLPLVIPESLRNGTPVLCSDQSGMGNLIEKGITGDLLPLDPGALAGVLDKLDKSRLTAMRPAARQAWERRFTLDRMLDRLDALFRQVAGAR